MRDTPRTDEAVSETDPGAGSAFRARFDATKAALEGKKLNANPYGENDPLHWQWLDAWAATKMDLATTDATEASKCAPRGIHRVLSDWDSRSENLRSPDQPAEQRAFAAELARMVEQCAAELREYLEGGRQ